MLKLLQLNQFLNLKLLLLFLNQKFHLPIRSLVSVCSR